MIQGILDQFSEILQAMLFLTMLSMGMALRKEDFLNVVKFPRAVMLGLTNQIILLPVIGFILASLLPLDPIYAMGLMVIAVCPGGSASNFYTFLAKGDTALSVTMSAISGVITMVTIPIILGFSLKYFNNETTTYIILPFWNTMLFVGLTMVLPIIIGMLIRAYVPKLAKNVEGIVTIGTGVIIILAIVLLFMKLDELGNPWEFIKASLIAVLLLNLMTLCLGFFTAKWLGLNVKQSISISYESGIQNGVLGITIAAAPSILNSPIMGTASGVYGLVMLTTGLGLIFIFRKMK